MHQISFLVVGEDGKPTGVVVRSKSPDGAALRLAARGYRQIQLADPVHRTLYCYEGAYDRGERSITDFFAWLPKSMVSRIGSRPRVQRLSERALSEEEAAQLHLVSRETNH
jgi:hypothetical protein